MKDSDLNFFDQYSDVPNVSSNAEPPLAVTKPSPGINFVFMEEMEALSAKLKEKEQELREIEAGILNEAQKWPQGERAHLYFQLQAADDRYARLLDAHRRLAKVNQSLEDKLLRLADKFESEKNALVAALSHTTQQLAEAHINLKNTKEELERYKSDCSLAVHLLQCRSNSFLSQRIEAVRRGQLAQQYHSSSSIAVSKLPDFYNIKRILDSRLNLGVGDYYTRSLHLLSHFTKRGNISVSPHCPRCGHTFLHTNRGVLSYRTTILKI
jgi:hypothetical protein